MNYSLSLIFNDEFYSFYFLMVEDKSEEIFLPQGDPAPWLGKTIQLSLSSLSFYNESKRYDANF